MRFLWKPFRLAADVLTADATPRQLAFGIAFGLLLGLVPKGNLIAAALVFVLSAIRVNLAAAAFSAFVFSWLGPFADPLTDRVGSWLLNHESLQSFWTSLANRPIVPWTSFHNTVVLGSVVTGLVCFYPVYRASLWPLNRYLPRMQAFAARFRIARWLWGAEWADRIGGLAAATSNSA